MHSRVLAPLPNGPASATVADKTVSSGQVGVRSNRQDEGMTFTPPRADRARFINRPSIAALVAALGLIAAACGNGSSSGEQTAPASSSAPTSTGAGDATNTDGGGQAAASAYTDCLTTNADAPVPEDLYAVSPLEPSTLIPGFDQQAQAYGITFAVREGVPTDFVDQVIATTGEMFSPNVSDPTTQQEIIRQLYRNNAVIPIYPLSNVEESEAFIETVDYAKVTICDVIYFGTDGQAMEVLEHLLHYITDVGFHPAGLDQWQLSETSPLNQSARESTADGVYNHDYTHPRVTLQEFAYWLASSHWDLQTQYGPNENEWTATTPGLIADQVPSAQPLLTQLDTVLAPPSTASMDALSSFEPRS